MGELGNCNVCGKDATALYPLLPREPAFCSDHHNPRDAGPFGCDFSEPDDFDIPIAGELLFPEVEPLWVTKDGKEFYDGQDIEDDHLLNIVWLLHRRAKEACEGSFRREVLKGKLEEMERIAIERGLM